MKMIPLSKSGEEKRLRHLDKLGKVDGTALTITDIMHMKDCHGQILCKCICRCGNFLVRPLTQVLNRYIKSCGKCDYNSEMLKKFWAEKRFVDLSGRQFGHLTAVRYAEEKHVGYSGYVWECLCECGNTTYVVASNLLRGKTRSCGKCNFRYESAHSRKIRLTPSDSRIAGILGKMKQRCYNPSCKEYKWYGARNPPIKVCSEWLTDTASFIKWAKDHGYRDDLTIDRIDVHGNYCPENCRWISMKEQANNRTDNRFISVYSTRKTVAQWCDLLDVDRGWAYQQTDRCLEEYFDYLLSMNETDEIYLLTKDLPNPDIWQTDPTWLPRNGFEPLDEFRNDPTVIELMKDPIIKYNIALGIHPGCDIDSRDDPAEFQAIKDLGKVKKTPINYKKIAEDQAKAEEHK